MYAVAEDPGNQRTLAITILSIVGRQMGYTFLGAALNCRHLRRHLGSDAEYDYSVVKVNVDITYRNAQVYRGDHIGKGILATKELTFTIFWPVLAKSSPAPNPSMFDAAVNPAKKAKETKIDGPVFQCHLLSRTISISVVIIHL